MNGDTAWHAGTEYAQYYGCTCPRSDAWRCALATHAPNIACACHCHRYADAKRARERDAQKGQQKR